MTAKQTSNLLMKNMITDRIGRPEVLLLRIKNITLSEDHRKGKEIGEKFAKPITFEESLIPFD